jgi:hypothetical protein
MFEEAEMLFVKEEWSALFSLIKGNPSSLDSVDLEWLLMYKLKYHLTNDGLSLNTIQPFIDYCLSNGLGCHSIPLATLCNDTTTINELIIQGNYIDEMLPNEMNGLIVALVMNDLKLVKLFLFNGSNINHQDLEGLTALDYCHDPEMLLLLHQHNAKSKSQLKAISDDTMDAMMDWTTSFHKNYMSP